MTSSPTKADSVGRRIASAREQKGYSQAALAASIGVTPGAVAQYETGRNLPRLQKLEKIATILETSTEWLLTGGEPDELVRAQTRTEEAMLRLIRAIPAEEQASAMAMLEGLAARHPKVNR